MLQLLQSGKAYQDMYFAEDNSAQSTQLQADGIHVPVKLRFQDAAKNGYYQLLQYTTVSACIAESQRISS